MSTMRARAATWRRLSGGAEHGVRPARAPRRDSAASPRGGPRPRRRDRRHRRPTRPRRPPPDGCPPRTPVSHSMLGRCRPRRPAGRPGRSSTTATHDVGPAWLACRHSASSRSPGRRGHRRALAAVSSVVEARVVHRVGERVARLRPSRRRPRSPPRTSRSIRPASGMRTTSSSMAMPEPVSRMSMPVTSPADCAERPATAAKGAGPVGHRHADDKRRAGVLVPVEGLRFHAPDGTDPV